MGAEVVDEIEKILKLQRDLDAVEDLQNRLSPVSRAMEAANRAHPSAFLENIVPSPFIESMMKVKENSSFYQLQEGMKRHGDFMRVAIGPLTELRRVGLFDPQSSLANRFAEAGRQLAAYEERFVLPGDSEVMKFVRGLEGSPAISAFKQFQEQQSGLKKAMESMRSPWLDLTESARSIRGFSEIQAIGFGLRTQNTFGEGFTSAIRGVLGDWRDPIDWSGDAFADLSVREQLYDDLGFDHAVSDFPAEAFEQGIEIAGLSGDPPPLVSQYGAPVPEPHDEGEKTSLERTNLAHLWLHGFESHLRRFMDERMTACFGPDWPKTRLPNGMYDDWVRKERKAVREGRPQYSLIARADFTDYVEIICKRDNWKEVFSPYFLRSESFRESMQRMYPIRLDTMHSRLITQDDELLLYVEVRRIMKIVLA